MQTHSHCECDHGALGEDVEHAEDGEPVADVVAHAERTGALDGSGRRLAAIRLGPSPASRYPQPDLRQDLRITSQQHFCSDEARQVGEAIGIDWSSARFDVEQFRQGMDVELEHGRHDPMTDVTGDDPQMTAKIALAHLNEFPDYYTRLARMESEAERDWSNR